MFKRFTNRALVRLLAGLTVIALIGGFAYAVIVTKQGKYLGSSISSASSVLTISRDGQNFATTQGPLTFSNVLPGGPQKAPDGSEFVYLRNEGSTSLNPKFSVSSQVTIGQGVDTQKIFVILSKDGTGTPQRYALHDLISSDDSGGLPVSSGQPLAPQSSVKYSVKIEMEVGAAPDTGGTVGNIDFAFAGEVEGS